MAVETRESDVRIGFPDPKNPRNTFFPDFIGPGEGRGKGNIFSYLFPKWKDGKGPRGTPGNSVPKVGITNHTTVNQSSDPIDYLID